MLSLNVEYFIIKIIIKNEMQDSMNIQSRIKFWLVRAWLKIFRTCHFFLFERNHIIIHQKFKRRFQNWLRLFFSSLISFRGNWRYYTSQILNIYYYLRIIFHLEWLIDFFQSIINSGKSIIGSNTNRKPTSSIYFVNTNSSNTKEQSMSRTIYDT